MKFYFTHQMNGLILQHQEKIIDAIFYNSYVDMPQNKEDVEGFMQRIHEDALRMLEKANLKMQAVTYARNMSMIQLTLDNLFMKPAQKKHRTVILRR